MVKVDLLPVAPIVVVDLGDVITNRRLPRGDRGEKDHAAVDIPLDCACRSKDFPPASRMAFAAATEDTHTRVMMMISLRSCDDRDDGGGFIPSSQGR